jgi:glutamate dehydrogenase
MKPSAMSASLEQSRQQLLHTAAERADHAGGEAVEEFLRTYYRHVATEDLLARAPEDLLGAAMAHRELAQDRPVGTAKVEVFNPEVEEQGWASGHTVVQIATDDMPFLVDSVSAELQRMERAVHLVVHPTMRVRRNAAGQLEEVVLGEAGTAAAGTGDKGADDGFGLVRESWMHLEIDRDSSATDRAAVADGLRSVLGNVREAVEDWPKMKATCSQVARDLVDSPPTGIPAEEVEQARGLLEWLADNHFTFLGYRQYALHRGTEADTLEAVQGTGLGLLRYDPTGDGVLLSEQARAVARARELLIITKANSRATVHRNTYLDYVSVKQFDEAGEVTGEKRFLGLFTSSAYTESVTRVPVLRDKVAAIFQRTGFLPDSHSGKDLLEVLENYPRDELFQAEEESLYDNATSVLHLQERRKTKLFLRRDRFGRFVSCLVYIPRDRYNTGVRLKMESILRQAFPGATVDFTTRVSESVLARLHFVVRVPSGESIPSIDEAVLERQLVDATRTWDEDLGEAARSEHGEEAAARLAGL